MEVCLQSKFPFHWFVFSVREIFILSSQLDLLFIYLFKKIFLLN